MRKHDVHNVTLGQAGVHRVMSQLLARGISAGILSADTAGVDIVTLLGARIQVKSAQLQSMAHYTQPFYCFELRRTRLVGLHRIQRRNRTFSAECDFVILWGVDEDRLWIVPAHILDGRCSIRIGLAPSRLVTLDAEGLRHEKAEGLSYRKLAEKHGVSVQIVWDRLNGHPDPGVGKFARSVRDCENRWDFIESFNRTAAAAAVDVTKELDASRPATEVSDAFRS